MMDGIVDSYGWYRGVGSFTPRGTAPLLAVYTGIVQCLGCNKLVETHIEYSNMNSIYISPLPMLRIT